MAEERPSTADDYPFERVGRGWIFWIYVGEMSVLCGISAWLAITRWAITGTRPNGLNSALMALMLAYLVVPVVLSFRPAPGLAVLAPETVDGIELPERSMLLTAWTGKGLTSYLFSGSDGVVRIGEFDGGRWSEIVAPEGVHLRLHWTGLCQVTVGSRRIVVLWSHPKWFSLRRLRVDVRRYGAACMRDLRMVVEAARWR